MATISKNKNYLEFYFKEDDKDKPYKLNINTGEFLGKTGKVLKHCPSGFKKLARDTTNYNGWGGYNLSNVSNVLLVILSEKNYTAEKDIELDNPYILNLMSLADRLESINYRLTSPNEITRSRNADFINKHFKEFAKARKENATLTIEEFMETNKTAMWLSENNIETSPYVTSSMVSLLMENGNSIPKDYYNLALWYMAHGLWTYENGQGYSIIRKLNELFEYAEKLQMTPTKDNFMSLYVQYKETYEMNKAKIDNARLEQVQLNHNLEFENDLFKVIVPTTREEFKNEADMQDNCVYRMYLERVINNQTNVVFIRSKSNLNHSHITCEVDHNGYIEQFYLAHNSTNYSEEDRVFKRAYQEHLNTYYKR